MITPKALHALRILRDYEAQHGGYGHWPTAQEFGLLLWPDNPNWRRYHKCGTHGACAGAPMWRAAGAYLAKLRTAGLVWNDDRGYCLTSAGRAALAQSEGPAHE